MSGYHVNGTLARPIPRQSWCRSFGDARTNVDNVPGPSLQEMRQYRVYRVEDALDVDVEDTCHRKISTYPLSIICVDIRSNSCSVTLCVPLMVYVQPALLTRILTPPNSFLATAIFSNIGGDAAQTFVMAQLFGAVGDPPLSIWLVDVGNKDHTTFLCK